MIAHWNTTAAVLAAPVFAHLWQSTVFAAAAGLIVLALRRKPARVRYWLWLAASLKFLIPFSLLVAIGGQFSRAQFSPGRGAQMESFAQEIGHVLAYAPPVVFPKHAPAAAPPLAAALLISWLAGSAIVLLRWWIRWHGLHRAVRHATPLHAGRVWEAVQRIRQGNTRPRILLASAPSTVEPGVFGILRPTLVLPDGIQNHLSEQQLDAVLAHELCHARRRDNLAALLHMLAEAAFWFHPLVWWVGARLVVERERACDEEVLKSIGHPETYAASILKICELYLEPPLACVSGVMGSNLKHRIEDIMMNRTLRNPTLGTRVLLAFLGVSSIAGPVLLGIVTAPVVRAQTPSCSLCEPPDSIRPALQAAFFVPSGPDGGTRPMSAVLDDRFRRISQLRAQHPNDFWVLRSYIDCLKVGVVSPATMVSEFRDRYNARPEDPEAKFLYAYALYGGDSRQAVSLLSEVVASTPAFPLAWYTLAKLYTFEREVQDFGKAQDAAEHFLSSCPDSNGAVYLASRLPNTSRLANMAPTLRAHISARVDFETPDQYRMLWIVELRTTPAAELPRLRERVQQDMAFLGTLDRAKYPTLDKVLAFGRGIVDLRGTMYLPDTN